MKFKTSISIWDLPEGEEEKVMRLNPLSYPHLRLKKQEESLKKGGDA